MDRDSDAVLSTGSSSSCHALRNAETSSTQVSQRVAKSLLGGGAKVGQDAQRRRRGCRPRPDRCARSRRRRGRPGRSWSAGRHRSCRPASCSCGCPRSEHRGRAPDRPGATPRRRPRLPDRPTGPSESGCSSEITPFRCQRRHDRDADLSRRDASSAWLPPRRHRHAAAGDEQRTLRLVEEPHDLADALAVGAQARGHPARRPNGVLALDLGEQDVEREVDEHRTRPARRGDLVRLVEACRARCRAAPGTRPS